MERLAAQQLRCSLRLIALPPQARAGLHTSASLSTVGVHRGQVRSSRRSTDSFPGKAVTQPISQRTAEERAFLRAGAAFGGLSGWRARVAPVRCVAADASTSSDKSLGGVAVPSPGIGGGDGGDDKWQIKMLYDGDCPLCMREVDMLRGRNEKYGTIKFVDIAAADYDPAQNAGVDFETAMGRIHGIERDGAVVTNVAAFRKFYEAVGLGWVYAITRFRPLGMVADIVYDAWARYRLPITGRPPLATVMDDRQKRLDTARGGGQRCRTDS